jgi:hypothetical protein
MFPDLLRDDVFRLETRRLWLRWPRAADTALIASLAGERDVAEMTANIPHPYPPGAKSYNKGKPIRIEEFDPIKAWWGSEADGFQSRVENERAWRVSIDQIKANGFNLDLKNPHSTEEGPGDVDHLLPEYEKLLAQIVETRMKLKQELHHALTATRS